MLGVHGCESVKLGVCVAVGDARWLVDCERVVDSEGVNEVVWLGVADAVLPCVGDWLGVNELEREPL